jgi:6-phosphogluconate dehydrogenase (decarboxylating) (EC 1.1.1.44)
MVHNGIEYGDMQLIGEAYQLMSDGLGLGANEMHSIFAAWNQGPLNSYLIEITAAILAYKDEDGQLLLKKILDTAGQKGTGNGRHQCPGLGYSVNLDRRVGICPLLVRAKRGTG